MGRKLWKLGMAGMNQMTSSNPDLAMFEELSLRAFKDGENLIG